MDFIIVGVAALIASLLTFFSGFGLGTMLTPVFFLFFEMEVAIAMTGIVHLLNNIFKFALVKRWVNFGVLLRFGLPSMLGAFIGAQLLFYLSDLDPFFKYKINFQEFTVTPVNMIIAFLLIFFVIFEAVPKFKNYQLGPKHLIPGGVLSGFFGGLSGHQGALRTMFLVKAGLSKEAFIATGISIACLVDLTRLTIYWSKLKTLNILENWEILSVAIVSAFLGAIIGKLALKKTTFRMIQITISILIVAIAVGLGSGLLSPF
ncbi:MAG: sulfite exporter TauE/SafE family protein [Flavobacteriales bacterium]|nr:sulfite exporter TauE/SafE family protein [Flavobacteriales bacterium]